MKTFKLCTNFDWDDLAELQWMEANLTPIEFILYDIGKAYGYIKLTLNDDDAVLLMMKGFDLNPFEPAWIVQREQDGDLRIEARSAREVIEQNYTL
jgi:hypothetical protein